MVGDGQTFPIHLGKGQLSEMRRILAEHPYALEYAVDNDDVGGTTL